MLKIKLRRQKVPVFGHDVSMSDPYHPISSCEPDKASIFNIHPTTKIKSWISKKPSPMSYRKTLMFSSEPISRIQPQNGSHSSFSFREDNDFPKKPLIRQGTTTEPPRLIGSKTGKKKSAFFCGSAKESKKVVQSFGLGKQKKLILISFAWMSCQQTSWGAS